MLDMMFSQHDLAWLDDLLPEKEKKKKEEDKKKRKEKDKKKSKVNDSEEEVRNSHLCCPLQELWYITLLTEISVLCLNDYRKHTMAIPTTPQAQSRTLIAGTVF